LIAAGVLLLVTAGLGGLLGIAGLSWYQASRPIDPAGPRQLTLEQAKALEWATSAEGVFARNLMNWNQDLLSRDRNGQLVCANEVKRLGVTLEMRLTEKPLLDSARYGFSLPINANLHPFKETEHLSRV
jgi:hypothetical protein